MFVELNNALNWEAEKFFPTGKFVLVQDEAASTSRADFLPLHFLLMNLKTNRNVIFISFDTAPSLLAAAARKTGVNIQHFEASRSLFLIDAFSEPFAWAKDERSLTTQVDSSVKYRVSLEVDPSTTRPAVNPLKVIYDKVKEAIGEIEAKGEPTSPQQLCLIIDNLNLLPGFCSQAHVLEFISHLKSLSSGKVFFLHFQHTTPWKMQTQKQVEQYLVALMHVDEEEDRGLIGQLAHISDLIIYSKSFRSGYLLEVDGELSFHCKHKINPFELNAPLPSALHFRVSFATNIVFKSINCSRMATKDDRDNGESICPRL